MTADGRQTTALGLSFADADGHIWRELSLSRLIATPDFLMVGR